VRLRQHSGLLLVILDVVVTCVHVSTAWTFLRLVLTPTSWKFVEFKRQNECVAIVLSVVVMSIRSSAMTLSFVILASSTAL